MVHPGWHALAAADKANAAPPLLTVPEVLRQLKISRETLGKMVREGKLRAIKVERSVRFRQADVDAYLERRATREA